MRISCIFFLILYKSAYCLECLGKFPSESPRISSANKNCISPLPLPIEEVISEVFGDNSAIIFSGITSISTAHAPIFSSVFRPSYRLLACSIVFLTALKPPVQVLFLGTRPICPSAGIPACAIASINRRPHVPQIIESAPSSIA